MTQSDFSKIAVIGAGTMGSGIAAQIANAGHDVLLLDLDAHNPGDKTPAEMAIDRLLASDPPQLMDKKFTNRISTGTIDGDLEKLADYDWVIEAVVERLDIKKALYKRLDDIVPAHCIISSNTSTIPIRLLVEDMPIAFKKRFAITHYFNPVRYMRLLELVRGSETEARIIEKLADFNDRVLGKGVVRCADTPGFLGNRVGVFALQVGIDEAFKCGLSVEDADALMGRPMGIPKTGVFGLYDLIGIDLMVDVVASLASILPENDAFHAVGGKNPMIDAMIANGYTGDKGKGGFYVTDDDENIFVRPLGGAELLPLKPVKTTLPESASKAAEATAQRAEPLDMILAGDDINARFCRRVLGRVLAYAASLIPAVTNNPQDIDDAMKLGFNWIRGPFELIDAIGYERMQSLMSEAGVTVPEVLKTESPFYQLQGSSLMVRDAAKKYNPVMLPTGVIRFHMTRRSMTPIISNNSASLFVLDGFAQSVNDLRLIEFHSKANALNDESMEIVAAATKDHGSGIIVHNDAQHFSAGVDLNAFRAFIEAEDWDGIDKFLARFQDAVCALKYTPVPVIGAPSGLAVGGGFEVLAHCDKLAVHSNSVLGLVEAGVGVVPGGGGIKETFLRWQAAGKNVDDAAWKTWMNIGYGATGSSPNLSAKMQYFRPDHDEAVMNRDRLLTKAISMIGKMQDSYRAPDIPSSKLADANLADKMAGFMQEGIDRGDFMPHDKTVAMAIASVMLQRAGDGGEIDEQGLYDREREAFITLAKTKETYIRISSMLDNGSPVRN
ncbi:3-hydroxyacyl-CoA dehydrogenase NAD-binding domain-containing protein [Candidatus Puniceispirillum sp.]|uniref:3-hydroxyacyl-CoA dehydrogenase/enoyl-CoA hydratase family protein n=1 Tax=Candidatus Puniceispirillum sp. TaxID=2026719 RepID=UPI003F6A1095